MVLYNLKHPSPETAVRGKISLNDYRYAAALLKGKQALNYYGTPVEGIAAYSAEGGRALTASRPELDVEITGFQDRLFILAPIVGGWAVIGRGDKFLSPCAVEGSPEYAETSLRFRIRESGPVVIWHGKGPVKAGGTPLKIWGTDSMNFNSPSPPGPWTSR